MEDGTIFISHNNGKGVRKYKNLEAVKNEEYEAYLVYQSKSLMKKVA